MTTKAPVTRKNKKKSSYAKASKDKKKMPVRYDAFGKRVPFLPTKHKERLHYPPTNIDLQNELADKLITWAQQDDALCIDDFALKEQISPYRFKRMNPDNEYLQHALEYARAAIGSRLFKLGLLKQVDSGLVAKTMPLYNEEYRAFVLDKQEKANQNIAVIMEKFPNVQEVPPLKDNDEF